jgi:hypothetical protein
MEPHGGFATYSHPLGRPSKWFVGLAGVAFASAGILLSLENKRLGLTYFLRFGLQGWLKSTYRRSLVGRSDKFPAFFVTPYLVASLRTSC